MESHWLDGNFYAEKLCPKPNNDYLCDMENTGYQFEVCANGVESCLAAQRGGADRVELCAGMLEGGTTPSWGEIAQAREFLFTTRLHVIIRPRSGDFVYSDMEINRMAKDIQAARQLGADGVVFGCLTPSGDVDTAACRKLLPLTVGMSVTFHRAFDRCRNPRQALEEIIEMGFHRILTSGQAPTAEQGIPLLAELQRQTEGRIVLLAGSGVNEQNIVRIQQETGIHEFHFSAREIPSVAQDSEFGTYSVTSEQRVRAIIERLK